MLSLKQITEQIEISNELTEITIETMGGETAFVRKYTRRDTKEFSKSDDILAAMIYVGIVDDKGARIFESSDQVQDLSDTIVSELFKLVSEHNAESVETQAKK